MSVTLHGVNGETKNGTALDLVRVLLQENPTVVWLEPTPQATTLRDFLGLWVGAALSTLPQRLKATIELDEARVFWADGWVHLVATPGRLRWAAFREKEAEPAWLKRLSSDRKLQEGPWENLDKREDDLLLIRDLNRYGLVGKDFVQTFGEKLKVIEYRKGTSLSVWRLEVAQ